MKRRAFLAGLVGIPRISALMGCSSSVAGADLHIHLLDGSIPDQLIKVFRKQITPPTKVNFDPEPSFLALFQKLRAWQSPPKKPVVPFPMPFQRTTLPAGKVALVSLSDYWLAPAVKEALIEPLGATEAAISDELKPPWPDLIRRDRQGFPSADGDRWGIPYRWGSLQIVYNRAYFESLGWQPQSWADLWKPELKHQFSLPDHPRLVLGIALKKLGASANSPDIDSMAQLPDTLTALNQQTRFYNSDHYLEPLVLEDTALAVGWSTDILPLLQQYRQFGAVVPTEGTLLTADVWVKATPHPATAPGTEKQETPALPGVGQQWLTYCLDPETAIALSIYSQGASPRFWAVAPEDLPPGLQQFPLLTLTPELQQKSEFLYPATEAVQKTYDQFWQEMRSQKA